MAKHVTSVSYPLLYRRHLLKENTTHKTRSKIHHAIFSFARWLLAATSAAIVAIAYWSPEPMLPGLLPENVGITSPFGILVGSFLLFGGISEYGKNLIWAPPKKKNPVSKFLGISGSDWRINAHLLFLMSATVFLSSGTSFGILSTLPCVPVWIVEGSFCLAGLYGFLERLALGKGGILPPSYEVGTLLADLAFLGFIFPFGFTILGVTRLARRLLNIGHRM